MSRPVRTLLCLLVLLFLPGPARMAGAEDAPPTWYAQTLSRGEAGLNVTHFWSKGAMLRSETVVAGHKMVTIVSGDWYWAYDALDGTGLAIRREPAAVAKDDATKRPFGREHGILVEQGAERVRTEDLMGRQAGIYRVTDERGRRELWVTEDEARIPLRLEIFERRSGGRRTVDWVNWQSDLPIPDSFFRPDANAKLTELSHSEYLARSGAEGSVGPVPVLYLDLLYVPAQK